METPKPDDSHIRQYAETREMHFQWCTIPDEGRWKAEVTLGRMGTPGCRWVGKADTEQGALDQGMHYATSYYEATRTACQGISHLTPGIGTPSDRHR